MDPHPSDPAPAKADPGTPGPASPVDEGGAAKLSPEEQMALFEKEMKERDWGHQPC